MEMLGTGFIAAVFTAGLLSFFSPCVLPLLPVYLGYLSSEQDVAGPGGASLLKALAFILGISCSFFLLGFGAGALGGLFGSRYFFLACGVIVVIFGLYQTGLVKIPFLERERRLNVGINPRRGLLGAFALGFLFSFGWTPCVGPVLGAVLGLSAQQGGAFTGGGLLLIYALGLSLPFAVLAFGSKHLLARVRGIYQHLGKIRLAGGLLIMIMGAWMIWGQLAPLNGGEDALAGNGAAETASRVAARVRLEALDGAAASLADFRGKVVYIKFWATWCPLCLAGLEDFTALAGGYAGSADVAVISVVMPGINGEVSKEDFKAWARAQDLKFPIYFDESGALAREFGVRAYPTSVYLGRDGVTLKQTVGDELNDRIVSELSRLGV